MSCSCGNRRGDCNQNRMVAPVLRVRLRQDAFHSFILDGVFRAKFFVRVWPYRGGRVSGDGVCVYKSDCPYYEMDVMDWWPK